jgi:hypothetical protein
MSVESDNDRLGFLELEEFGVSATITSNSSTYTVQGIFDNGHFQIDNGFTVVSTLQTTFLCRTADIAEIEQGDAVVVSGVTYKVVDIQPDGTGMTTLRLQK